MMSPHHESARLRFSYHRNGANDREVAHSGNMVCLYTSSCDRARPPGANHTKAYPSGESELESK